jgi:hypothetical protein
LTTGSALTFDGNKLTSNALTFGYNTSYYNTDNSISNYSAGNYLYVSGNSTGGTGGLYLQGAGNQKQAIILDGISSGGNIAFKTNGTEAMRIDTSQNLLVGTTSASGKVTISSSTGTVVPLYINNSDSAGGVGATIYLNNTGSSGKNYFISSTSDVNAGVGGGGLWFCDVTASYAYRLGINTSGYVLIGYTSSNGAYKLQVNSQIFATNSTIATSDARYKTNVTPISNGLALVNKLKPVSFDWKKHSVHDFDTQNTNVGFLAQDIQEVLKDEIYLNSVIRKNETKLPDGTKEEFLGLADSSLIPILVKAIQELSAQVTTLTTRLTALENK